MILDVSHISDQGFWQVLEASTAPVFASHSSARALHDHPRNLTDDMIRAIADEGRDRRDYLVPGILLGGASARAGGEGALDRLEGAWIRAGRARDAGDRDVDAKLRRRHARQVQRDDGRKGLPMPTIGTIVAHVAHVANLIGADRVCLGSDHGAVRFDIPGFEDCTKWAVVTQALKDHGFSDRDVRNILGENVLRLMERVIGA